MYTSKPHLTNPHLQPHSLTSLHSTLFTTTTLLTLPLSVFLLAFTTYLQHHATLNSSATIRSYTCTFTHAAQTYNHLLSSQTSSATSSTLSTANGGSTPALTPGSFAYICTESTAGWGLTIGLVALQLVALTLVLYGSSVDRDIKFLRRARSDYGHDQEKGGNGGTGQGGGGMRGLVSHMSW